ncbi:MAG: DUF4058 family protein [Planctomycetes bacterium]|nr:DUF4058 family protein [Planctomycetota bacterium]
MPIHDWSRGDAGIFHGLHIVWIGRLQSILNEELLPGTFYALAEPVLGSAVPDVLTLEWLESEGMGTDENSKRIRKDTQEAPVALAPSTVLVQELDPPEPYTFLARHLIIRSHLRDDKVVAIIELVSKANKDSELRSSQFTAKSLTALRQGIHLVFIDLHPPTPIVPQGFHQQISLAHGIKAPVLPPDRTLQAVSYQVLEDKVVRAHVVPLKVGDSLPEMPVFLLPHEFVRLPLERSYTEAFQSLPRRFQQVLQSST